MATVEIPQHSGHACDDIAILSSRADPPHLPVKNTFIHFDVPNADCTSASKRCGRSLRRWQTDPDEPTAQKASFSGQSSTGGTAEIEVSSVLACRTRSIATQTQDAVAEFIAEEEAPDMPAAGFRGCVPELACQLDTSSFSGDGESTAICTPEHSPRFGRPSWSFSTPCTSPDRWLASASTPGRSSGCLGTPASDVSVIDELAYKPLIATSMPLAMALPSSPVPSSPSVPSSGFFDGGFTFTFTLRLADGHGLGIDVAEPPASEVLIVQQVLPEGAIEAWNKQCLDGSVACLKVVQYGDVIVRVNGRTERQGMLQECKEKMLLKLTVVRRFPEYFQSLNASAANFFSWPGLESFLAGHSFAHPGAELQACNGGGGKRLHASKFQV